MCGSGTERTTQEEELAELSLVANQSGHRKRIALSLDHVFCTARRAFRIGEQVLVADSERPQLCKGLLFNFLGDDVLNQLFLRAQNLAKSLEFLKFGFG